ncbi:MAG TPA: CTP synthase, partial [Actinomycetes bacterium]|nr:CTP synthase [Actinomycetes bacterium]
MPRAQRPRDGEELLAPFRILAGGEDLATAGAALLERACRALEAVEGVLLLEALIPEFRSRPTRPHPLFRDFVG